MVKLNGIQLPNGYTGIGMHDTPGAETATWGESEAEAHASLLKGRGITLYKLFGSATKDKRARAYANAGILVLHRYWPGGAHWGRPPEDWLMPRSMYDYLLDCGVSLFEPGWNEFNIQEEWVHPIPNAQQIAVAVVDAWEVALSTYGGGQHLLFPSNTPGGNKDHRACYNAICQQIYLRGLERTIKHVAIHPRPFNNPPNEKYSTTNTVTFDEWRWIRNVFLEVGVEAYYWATEHGYSLRDHQNANYPAINVQKHTEYNRNLQLRMNPNHKQAIEPELAGTCHWFEAGWGHWGPWSRDALRDGGDGMPAPSPLWELMGREPLQFERYRIVERAKLVDLSHWRCNAPLQKLWDMGYRGLMLRISGPRRRPDGTTDWSVVEKDKCFDKLYAEGTEIGFLIGGFYFLMPNIDRQARICFNAIGNKPMPLGVYCDAERTGLTLEKIDLSCRSLDGLRGETTGIYVNLSGYNRWNIGGWKGDRHLWAARPGIKDCDLSDWELWQRGYVTVDGVQYDDNRYNGSVEDFYEEYAPSNGGGGQVTVQVKDMHGKLQTLAWAQQKYGIEIIAASPPSGAKVARLVKLQEVSGPSVQVVTVLDEQGKFVPGALVCQGWVDGPGLPASEVPWLSPSNTGQPAGKPHRGMIGRTNESGDIGFGWGGGEQYDPSQGEVGAHWYWIPPDGKGIYTDVTLNYGWLWMTPHDCLRPTFQIVNAGETPEPTDVNFYDENGEEHDVSWAQYFFGTQSIHKPNELPVWRLTSLRERVGTDKTLTVTVLKEDGSPAVGVGVALGPRDVGGSIVRKDTGSMGTAAFAMNEQHGFYVPGQGHWAMAVIDGASDVYNSVGWVLGVNPTRWLNPIFTLQTDEPTPPPPPPCDLDKIRNLLIQALDELASCD